MITEYSLVIYKTKPAIVKERADGKFTIILAGGETVKVRDKDIDLLHSGPIKNFNELKSEYPAISAVREAWELLSDEDSGLTLKDVASFVCGEHTPSSAYTAYTVLKDGLFFTGTIDAVTLRSKDEIAAEEAKRSAALRDTTERIRFLERLKACLKKPDENKLLLEDSRFMQDVQALAFGKSAKSRTMKDLDLSETPEEAHALLLKTGLWSCYVNPHPSRFGISLCGAQIVPEPPSFEDRKDLTRLSAFAVDSPWSCDPDDAVSVEDGVLYVHIADPASSVFFDSPAEREARDRGATLYLPEGTYRMLAEETLPMFALGLSEKSPALTFKITINEDGEVKDTEIFPSIVKARRITYKEADDLLETDAELRELFGIAKKLHGRRAGYGAVNFELPDVYITVENENVKIEPIIEYNSGFIVKECMIAAGEGAGTWAASRGLAFPYISQEVELQGKISGGLAGFMQLRKCMRPRSLSVKPGRHQGLGLDTYTQVTSPLRRYTDLLAHIQIRAALRGEKPIAADEVSARLGFCEAAVAAVNQAERASNIHWKMVYLQDKKDSVWEAVALEKRMNRWAVIIPRLALETLVSLQKDVAPNDIVSLVLKSVNIAKGEAVFIHA